MGSVVGDWWLVGVFIGQIVGHWRGFVAESIDLDNVAGINIAKDAA